MKFEFLGRSCYLLPTYILPIFIFVDFAMGSLAQADPVTAGQTCNRVLRPGARERIQQRLADYLKEKEMCSDKPVDLPVDAEIRKKVGTKNDDPKAAKVTGEKPPEVVAEMAAKNRTVPIEEDWKKICAATAKKAFDQDIGNPEKDWEGKLEDGARRVPLPPAEAEKVCPPTLNQRGGLNRAYDYSKLSGAKGPVVKIEEDTMCACHPIKSAAGARELKRRMDELEKPEDKQALMAEMSKGQAWSAAEEADKRLKGVPWYTDKPPAGTPSQNIINRDTGYANWGAEDRAAIERQFAAWNPTKTYTHVSPADYDNMKVAGTDYYGKVGDKYVHVWEYCKDSKCYWTYGK